MSIVTIRIIREFSEGFHLESIVKDLVLKFWSGI